MDEKHPRFCYQLEGERISADQVEWHFSIPCNTTAKVTTPDGRSWFAAPGNYTIIVGA